MKMKFNLVVLVVLLALTTACKKETVNDKEVLLDSTSVQRPEAIETATPTAQVPTDGKYPAMTFQKEEHDFGTIKQGDKVSTDFQFKNTGEADLIITSARGSCGCTVPDYPKTPIKPGETGNIKVSFDSKGKQGKTSKTVTILCNTQEGNKILKINANIEVPNKN
jgi:major membrane immunogen (membrane-anchored lipoprotein)